MIRYHISVEDSTMYLIGDYIFTYYVRMQKFANKLHKLKPSMRASTKITFKEMPWSDFNLEEEVIEHIFKGTTYTVDL